MCLHPLHWPESSRDSPCRDGVGASIVLPHHSPILPRSSPSSACIHSLPLFLIRASVPGLQTLHVLHVHSSKYNAIPALRHSHKTNLTRSVTFLPLHMVLCGTWLALSLAWPQPSSLYKQARGKQAHGSFRSG